MAERRKAARAARGAEHAERLRVKRVRDNERAALLTELQRLAPSERLRRFACDEDIVLDAIPHELVPTNRVDRGEFDPEITRKLLKRIDRRRGVWALVRRALHQSTVEGQR